MSRVVFVSTEDGRLLKTRRWYRVIHVLGHRTPLEDEIARFDAEHPRARQILDAPIELRVRYGPSQLEELARQQLRPVGVGK